MGHSMLMKGEVHFFLMKQKTCKAFRCVATEEMLGLFVSKGKKRKKKKKHSSLSCILQGVLSNQHLRLIVHMAVNNLIKNNIGNASTAHDLPILCTNNNDR